MARSAIVVGSGAGGSVAAWTLVNAGWDVLVLEKGRNLLPGLGTQGGPSTLFSNDEVKHDRNFEVQDPLLEPRTSRSQQEATNKTARSFTGDVQFLPTTVGGGTVHWDAKVPRFWKQDFQLLSKFGPVPGANVADWPLTYDDLAPFYDEVEQRLGVQGDIHQMPASTLAQAPRSKQFSQPPNPPMHAGKLLAQGAADPSVGFHVYPFPMAVHSTTFQGRPACNSCGYCSGFGCPINARGGAAISFLHDALIKGARLETRTMVTRVDVGTGTHNRQAKGVTYIDHNGVQQHATADIVVLAPSPIETARLCLASATSDHPGGLGNSSGQLGRNLMFHFFTLGLGLFSDDVHGWMGPSTTFTMDDLKGPDTSAAARAFALTNTGKALPYLKGGICEVGGADTILSEAQLYASFFQLFPELGGSFSGTDFKTLMRLGLFRDHLSGVSMVGDDMPQLANVVDLDPQVRDVYGLPVPRITYSSHAMELASSSWFGPKLANMCSKAPGSLLGTWIGGAAASGGPFSKVAGDMSTAHIMGTARMGSDPKTSVTDGYGRMHDLDNVYVADGSVFVTSGGANPTNTIMSLALRQSRHIAASH